MQSVKDSQHAHRRVLSSEPADARGRHGCGNRPIADGKSASAPIPPAHIKDGGDDGEHRRQCEQDSEATRGDLPEGEDFTRQPSDGNDNRQPAT